ncbi:DUF4114 domain-containing protein [Waterburya agarophytonicola K14]|uniref:DUF4114 domain-containing protein n=1 Tax=Waterburya agarophytonicola KI4 TaxID=2874699 RepID=A0A964BRW9_9CYAN|nr:DUF4114 domain-containing protein [Waterburya agarophytonicola]MCC0178504.1 DUF4114 domain-containing protein [Waterburya agarophytonicola KI4]
MLKYETGTFTVDSQGKIEVDYLFDGGFFQGELGLFNLEGMDAFDPNSTEFVLEAVRRVSTRSNLGHIVINDDVDGARFESKLSYEPNFNSGEYQDIQTFEINPGAAVAFILAPNTSFGDILSDLNNISEFEKRPLFSIPELNLNESSSPQAQFVDINGNGTIGISDLPLENSKRDYNDLIYQVRGLEGNLPNIENRIDSNRDWRESPIGQEILEYTKSSNLNEPVVPEPEVVPEPDLGEGVFEVGETGEIKVDYLFDGGFFQGEVGIFSLEDLNPNDFASEAFVEEAVNRAKSNSTQGHIVISDATEGAKFSGDLEWEADFNRGEYSAKQSFEMNPGDIFGVVLVPDGTFDELLINPSASNSPLFSLPTANTNGQGQIAEIFATKGRTIVSLEDTFASPKSSIDYNDVILSIEGAEAIGISAIADVIGDNRNWLETEIGEAILAYGDDADL